MWGGDSWRGADTSGQEIQLVLGGRLSREGEGGTDLFPLSSFPPLLARKPGGKGAVEVVHVVWPPGVQIRMGRVDDKWKVSGIIPYTNTQLQQYIRFLLLCNKYPTFYDIKLYRGRSHS